MSYNGVRGMSSLQLGETMRRRYRSLRLFAIFTLIAFATVPAMAQAGLSSDLQQKIDKVAVDVLEATGVPSASVALVKDGRIVYLKAYGNARIDPAAAATPEMR